MQLPAIAITNALFQRPQIDKTFSLFPALPLSSPYPPQDPNQNENQINLKESKAKQRKQDRGLTAPGRSETAQSPAIANVLFQRLVCDKAFSQFQPYRCLSFSFP